MSHGPKTRTARLEGRGLRLTWLLLLLAAVVFLLAACDGGDTETETETESGTDDTTDDDPEPAAAGGGTLTMALPVDGHAYIGLVNENSPVYEILNNVQNRLLNYDLNGELAGELAEDWELSEDGREITFMLRDDVTWHDGEPFTSADVVYWLEAAAESGTAFAGQLANFTGVEAIDEHTVRATFSERISPHTFAYYAASTLVLPAHVYEGEDLESHPNLTAPIGTGPYRWVDYEVDQHIILEPNPDYFGEVPVVDQFVIRFIPDPTTALTQLRSGAIDAMNDRYEPPIAELVAVLDDPALTVHQIPKTVMPRLVFNGRPETVEAMPWLGEVDVRRAIAHAIDRDAIVNQVMRGLLDETWSFYGPTLPIARTDLPDYEYDPDQARAMLDEAGYPEGPDGVRFSAELAYIPFFGTEQMSQALGQMLGEVGIEIELVTADYNTFLSQYWFAERGLGDTPLAIYIGATGPNPLDLRLMYDSGFQPRLNGQGTSIERLDELFAEAAAAAPEDQAQYLNEVQEVLAEELPAYPFGTYIGYTVAGAHVGGLETIGGSQLHQRWNQVTVGQ